MTTASTLTRPDRPGTYYVRIGQLTSWLQEWGVSAWETRRLVEAGTIPAHRLHGSKNRYFVPQEIETLLGLGG